MFDDDQYTRYVNFRFPAIGACRQRETTEIEPPKAPFVVLAPIEPDSGKRTGTIGRTVSSLSEAA